MRKKISTGFISLACVLLLAGAISMYELDRLRKQSDQILELNTRNTGLADKMLKALQAQNSAILRMIITDAATPGAGYRLGLTAFNDALAAASSTGDGCADLSAVTTANRQYRNVIVSYLDNVENEDPERFLSSYLHAYYILGESLSDYLTSPENSIPARAQMLEKSVYKTITPSILTLLVAIIIVLMFYYFVDSYYVRPIISIHKSLDNYLSHNIPFNPKFESNDAVIKGVKDMIEDLTERKKNEPK